VTDKLRVRPLIKLVELIERKPRSFEPPQHKPLTIEGAPVRIMKRGEGIVCPGPAHVTPTREHGVPLEAPAARALEPVRAPEGQVGKTADTRAPAKVEWKVEAPEFDPFASPAVPYAKPLFTKPVINFGTIHIPQHVLLIRIDDASAVGGPAGGLQPVLDNLNAHLGPTWEVRTKPMHRDALLICASTLVADRVLNEPPFKVPGYTTMLWKPRFYIEP